MDNVRKTDAGTVRPDPLDLTPKRTKGKAASGRDVTSISPNSPTTVTSMHAAASPTLSISIPSDSSSATTPSSEPSTPVDQGKSLDQRTAILRTDTPPPSYSEYLKATDEYMQQKQKLIVTTAAKGLSDSACAAASGSEVEAAIQDYYKAIKQAGNQQLPGYKHTAMETFRPSTPPQKREALQAVKSLKGVEKKLIPELADDILDNAKLSKLSYKGTQVPETAEAKRELPAGYTLATDSDLPSELCFFYNDQSGLLNLPRGTKALLAKKDDGTLAIAFAGTEPKSASKTGRTGSIRADIRQWTGSFEPMYRDAAGIVKKLLDDPKHPERRLELAGHSLGGGLAQVAMTANIKGNGERMRAYGYNPAGIKLSTLEKLDPADIRMMEGKFVSVRVEGDPVSPSGASSVGEKLKGRLLGKTITLPPVRGQGTHGSDSVLAALEKELGRSSQTTS